MRKFPTSLFAVLFFAIMLSCIYLATMPRQLRDNVPLSEFSAKRAFRHVESIAARPHYTGSAAHSQVVSYLQSELSHLGLQSEIQSGYTVTEEGVLVYCRNIIARVPGSDSSKALLILSHYDSAPHSKSRGAADDASGIATILEGLRAFMSGNKPPKNDLIILFTDAEELGLNGAALFVEKHQLARKVGLAINFEARGTAGPSYMLMEVNQGNAKMTEGFADAGVPYPVANSLMYSIYKMLPNDTDLTVFREKAKIQGFNFAFIDDHFNYHTELDDTRHLDKRSLAHQGSYLMPLLSHFSNADLTNLNSTQDYVYFNIPFSIVSYPFSWVLPSVICCLVIFLALLFVGFGKKILHAAEIVKGLGRYARFILTSVLLAFALWKLLLMLYPHYSDIAQGFTYNGHDYMIAFMSVSVAVGFFFYSRESGEHQVMNQYVGPLFIMLAINFAVAITLPGAGFFVIPLLAGLTSFGYFIVTQRVSLLLNLLLTIPALVLLFPFITALPVGVGLKNLYIASALLSLMFGLFLPIVGLFRAKVRWGLVFLVIAIGYIVKAHIGSGYSAGKAKPNSLLYLQDFQTGNSYWLSYDKKPDQWTSTYLGATPKTGDILGDLPLYSKYGKRFNTYATAPEYDVRGPSIRFVKNSTANGHRYMEVVIKPNRTVNRYDIFVKGKSELRDLVANGISVKAQQPGTGNMTVLTYYIVGNMPLELCFNYDAKKPIEMELLESSLDLMENNLLKIKKRPSHMMPTPFVLNDAVLIRRKIAPTADSVAPQPAPDVQ